jgi:hypothetical protein
MTDLSYRKADFWRHTVQLAKRGLFPVGAMKEAHGPHSGKRWKNVECAFHADRERYSVSFAGADTWNGLRFEIDDDPAQAFPVLKREDKTARAEHWLRYAVRRTGDHLKVS